MEKQIGMQAFPSLSPPFNLLSSRGQNRKSRSSVFFFFCSETKRRRLLRRLLDALLSHDIFYLYSFKISMFPVFMPFWGSYLINF